MNTYRVMLDPDCGKWNTSTTTVDADEYDADEDGRLRFYVDDEEIACIQDRAWLWIMLNGVVDTGSTRSVQAA